MGDRVWLHIPAVPWRASRKFHHPWQGQTVDERGWCKFLLHSGYHTLPS